MNKELTTAEKSRRTKLSNKTSEELIDIIVRKDDVERRKDKLIKCLKTNILGLENKVESIKTDLNNVEQEYSICVDKNVELIKSFKAEIKYNSTLKEDIHVLNKQVDNLIKKVKVAINGAIKTFIMGFVLGVIVTAIIYQIF